MEPLHSCHYKKIFASSLANMWPADVGAEIVSGKKKGEKNRQIHNVSYRNNR